MLSVFSDRHWWRMCNLEACRLLICWIKETWRLLPRFRMGFLHKDQMQSGHSFFCHHLIPPGSLQNQRQYCSSIPYSMDYYFFLKGGSVLFFVNWWYLEMNDSWHLTMNVKNAPSIILSKEVRKQGFTSKPILPPMKNDLLLFLTIQLIFESGMTDLHVEGRRRWVDRKDR